MLRYKEIDVQHGSVDWHLWRSGRVTPSRLHTVLNGSALAKNKYLKELRGEFFPPPLDRVKAINWGRFHESIALANYNLETGWNCRSCGFFISTRMECVGGSPDGVHEEIAFDKPVVVHGVEIKCPYNSDNHLRTLHEGIPKQYEWQVKGYAWLLGLEYWDYVSFDPRQALKHQLYIQRVHLSDYDRDRISNAVSEFTRAMLDKNFEFEKEDVYEMLAAGKIPKLF